MPISTRKRRCRLSRNAKCVKCSRKILIVEDQLSLASMLEAILIDRYGCEAVVAKNLTEAKTLIHNQKFTVAISDLNLPDAPHGEIVDELVKADIATIALTGTFGEELRETILKKGVIDYIPKTNIYAYEYAADMVGRICRNHRTKVLIVDDSLSSRTLLKHILVKLRLSVLIAENGNVALEVLQAHPDIQLALIDYEMPEMDGFTCIHNIRKTFSKEQLAIIGISASNSDSISANFLKVGANDYIKKPFSYEEILCRFGQNLEMLELICKNKEAAYRDYLTGLYNRRYFFETGGEAYQQAVRLRHPLVVTMMDIDHFKKINDTYGHDIGDEVLKHFSSQLNEFFKQNLVARLGGEEFAIVLQNTDLQSAHKLVSEFVYSLHSISIDDQHSELPYTVSAGLSDDPASSFDSQLKKADKCLYQAKYRGRNQVVC